MAVADPSAQVELCGDVLCQSLRNAESKDREGVSLQILRRIAGMREIEDPVQRDVTRPVRVRGIVAGGEDCRDEMTFP